MAIHLAVSSATWTEQWWKSYARLPAERQASCDRVAMALIKGVDAPGLKVKPILPDKHHLEARVSSGDRIVFRKEQGTLVFVDVIKHDEIERYGRRPRQVAAKAR